MPAEPETPVDHAWNDELDQEAPFIDPVWLERVQFSQKFVKASGEFLEGNYEIVGLLGCGGNSVVFNARNPEGAEVALKMSRRDWSFPSYIHELSNCQEPDRLHRKLERLMGDPMLDQIVRTYSDLYRSLVDNLHGWPPFNTLKWNSEKATHVLSFGVRAPGTLSKLGQLASHSASRPETVAWAKQTLVVLDRINVEEVFRPEILLENPLYVWGGAILSGYFPGDTTDVRSRVRSRLTMQPHELETFVAQGWALAELLNQFQIRGAEAFKEFWEATCDGL